MQQALSRAITEDELIYIRAQYNLLEPSSTDGRLCIENFRMVSDLLLSSPRNHDFE